MTPKVNTTRIPTRAIKSLCRNHTKQNYLLFLPRIKPPSKAFEARRKIIPDQTPSSPPSTATSFTVNLFQMMKGYKVTDKSRSKLIGVACDSLKQLLTKGREKLGMPEGVVAALDDGTIVDDEDYFRGLPPQTVLILYRKNEEIITGVDVILNALRSVNTSYLETGSKAKEFAIARTNELMEILNERHKLDRDRIAKNTPQEDPDWFTGLETNARTKDEYMFKKSQDRIRGYFYKFREDMRKNKRFVEDPRFRGVVLQCLDFLKNRLKKDEYFGCYFDRRCAPNPMQKEGRRPARKKLRKQGEPGSSYDRLSYCDDAGNFVCQGKWRLDRCEFITDHRINPYLSREARIMFSTWNLDHRSVGRFRFCGLARPLNDQNPPPKLVAGHI